MELITELPLSFFISQYQDANPDKSIVFKADMFNCRHYILNEEGEVLAETSYQDAMYFFTSFRNELLPPEADGYPRFRLKMADLQDMSLMAQGVRVLSILVKSNAAPGEPIPQEVLNR